MPAGYRLFCQRFRPMASTTGLKVVLSTTRPMGNGASGRAHLSRGVGTEGMASALSAMIRGGASLLCISQSMPRAIQERNIRGTPHYSGSHWLASFATIGAPGGGSINRSNPVRERPTLPFVRRNMPRAGSLLCLRCFPVNRDLAINRFSAFGRRLIFCFATSRFFYVTQPTRCIVSSLQRS